MAQEGEGPLPANVQLSVNWKYQHAFNTRRELHRAARALITRAINERVSKTFIFNSRSIWISTDTTIHNTSTLATHQCHLGWSSTDDHLTDWGNSSWTIWSTMANAYNDNMTPKGTRRGPGNQRCEARVLLQDGVYTSGWISLFFPPFFAALGIEPTDAGQAFHHWATLPAWMIPLSRLPDSVER